jgi:hypothetical protein
MLPTILIIAAVIIVVLVIIVASRPADFRITRSITVSAPPETVFAQVNDFHKWEAWSPWAKLDPACKNNFMGKAFGLLMNCDKMVGGDFEKGPAAMKSVAETAFPK